MSEKVEQEATEGTKNPLAEWDCLLSAAKRPMTKDESELFIRLHFIASEGKAGRMMSEAGSRDAITQILVARLIATRWFELIDPDDYFLFDSLSWRSRARGDVGVHAGEDGGDKRASDDGDEFLVRAVGFWDGCADRRIDVTNLGVPEGPKARFESWQFDRRGFVVAEESRPMKTRMDNRDLVLVGVAIWFLLAWLGVRLSWRAFERILFSPARSSIAPQLQRDRRPIVCSARRRSDVRREILGKLEPRMHALGRPSPSGPQGTAGPTLGRRS